MTIAVACGLIILVLLVIMLLAGVPIAVALAVSSIGAILPVLDTGASVLTGAQRIFSGISVFSLLAIPFFILAGNLMNKGGIAIRLINFANIYRKYSGSSGTHQRRCQYAFRCHLRFRYGGSFRHGFDHRPYRRGRRL